MKELWKNLSIVKKIFAIFALVFVIFLAIWMIGQLVFFGKYYEGRKTKGLSRSVEAFSKEYLALDSVDDINKKIVEYANSGDAYYAVVTENGELLFMVTYELVVNPSDGGEPIKFSLDNAIHDENFLSAGFREGDSITVNYVAFGEEERRANIYFPDSITYGGQTWKNDIRHQGIRFDRPDVADNADFDKHFEICSVTGAIESITLPNQQSSRLTIQRNDVASVMLDFRERLYSGRSLEKGKNESYTFNTKANGDNYNVAVRRIEKYGNTEYICAILPMRNISEAISAVREFSLFLFAFMFVLMCIIARVFSHTLTKPIIEINNITEKMKMLDFSGKCKVDTQDELGMLAENVNKMSDRLDETIKELVEAKEQLTKDIERERLAEKQRKEFVAAASHELKTPLAIIRAYSEGIIDGIFKNKQEHYLKVIVEETEKMDKLVLDMIENTWLEMGAMQLDLKEHDICGFVMKITERFFAPCKADNIGIVTKIPTKPILRYFDNRLLEQVVTNFITNAIKNTHNGTIEVGVDESGVWVENEGKNIPDDEIDKIWDRFYKVDKSRERSGGGTGLGLSIAKNILVLHNASYKAENTKTGVRFSFSLEK